MTADEYALQQTLISAALARFVLQFGKFFVNPLLSLDDWIAFLRLLYPEVVAAREKSAVLARDFYDDQRRLAHPDLPTLARELEPYRFDWFVQAMEPMREVMSRESAPNTVLGQVASVAVREVENAGRRQIIHAVRADKPLDDKIVSENREKLKFDPATKAEILAILASGKPQERATWGGQTVEDDPVPYEDKSAGMVRGWARVATGRETCAFCLMLISRGPVYYEAGTAGVDLPDEEVIDMFRTSSLEDYFGDLKEFMPDEDAWHTNCDCKVVPVFDLQNWVGREASQKAFALWRKASDKADEALAEDPDKMYFDHTDKEWKPTTRNREAMNQLRKMLAAGAVKDWAALNAA